MNHIKNPRNGQALLLVTFALVAMIGVTGMAIDFSYAYFLEKTMQAAADAAALSATQRASEIGGPGGVGCTSAGVTCHTTQTSCSSVVGTSDYVACQYAQVNGFVDSEVTVESNDDTGLVTIDPDCPDATSPPSAKCVSVLFYVTVRISRQVPNLFSAFTSNVTGTVSARATAGVAEQVVPGSLLVLNRNNDLNGVSGPNPPPYSTNVQVTGGGLLNVPGGIILGSTSSTNGREAGIIQANSGRVVSPWTYTRASPPSVIGGSAYDNWVCRAGGPYCSPTTRADGDTFMDPFEVKRGNNEIYGQPPIYGPGESASGDALIPVPDGLITPLCPGGNCPTGIYFATRFHSASGNWYPSGEQLRTGNNDTVRFNTGTAFGRSVFVGGLSLSPGTQATMGPGRYVFAGANNTGDPVFQTATNVTLLGNTADAGRIMIYTDFRTALQGNRVDTPAVTSYAGQMEQIQARIQSGYTAPTCGATCPLILIPYNDDSKPGLKHGYVDIQAGNSPGSQLRLNGLNPEHASLPAELKNYGPVLMWQDQHNSYVHYDSQSRVDTSCSGGNYNSPCTNTVDHRDAPMLSIWASPNTTYNGVIYQPRGSWTKLQGSGRYDGPLMIVSGAMTLGGTPEVTLTGLPDPLSVFKVSLVE